MKANAARGVDVAARLAELVALLMTFAATMRAPRFGPIEALRDERA
jgi:hypothetical protein